jgi:thioredoxin reductase
MTVDVAVVGAGPYGLSLASHLRARRVDHRIFGVPMNAWRTQMPQGMFLKSDGFASNLYDPGGAFPLREYCAAEGLDYADLGLPIAREVFADYGVEFQCRFVPDLETTDVTAIEAAPQGFRLTLASGESLTARRVVLAVGITHFAQMPSQLALLPRTLASHSSHHPDLGVFAGREVVVIGAGASALDCAALLAKAGASVGLTARAAAIEFHDRGKQPRLLMDRLRAPNSGLGPGWRSRLATDLPLVFHAMPEKFRILVVRKHLGPAPGWWTRAMVEGKVDFHLGQSLVRANEAGGRLRMEMRGQDGTQSTLTADHAIAATGYHPDVARLGFLSGTLRAGIRTADDAPVLSRNFESSVRGLYFIGPASANSFGPVARFAFGARFTAKRLARHLHRGRVVKAARPDRSRAALPDAV